MKAYELLARLEFLTLAGRNEEGELEWIGTFQDWQEVANFEREMLRVY